MKFKLQSQMLGGHEETITQKVKYETVLEYCNHCKIQGHNDVKCRIQHLELRKEPMNPTNIERDLATKGEEKIIHTSDNRDSM
uniref:Putative ovule protein n=1 Tax=Solanum chacoense TaxID=4108 RepID=A0A0V0H7T9_SOLCH